MITKICKQCGTLKPIEQYRKYYGGRKGRYNTCKTCEKINARVKYLRSKDELTDKERDELDKVMKLYELQRAAGLQPPRDTTTARSTVEEDVDAMIAQYNDQAVLDSVDDGADKVIAPPNLQVWLTQELTEDPDYYLDDIYESLRDEYRPMLMIDNNLRPVYDDRYKAVLDKILERFYAYEEAYYNEED